MNFIFIRNRDIHNCILEYNLETGPIRELSKHEVAEDKVSQFANYINLAGDLWGVFSSNQGPMLFHGNEVIRLVDTSIKLEHIRGEKEHTFRLLKDEKLYTEKKYERWDDLDIDPWSDEDFIDFFIWLSKAYKDPSFIEMWSK